MEYIEGPSLSALQRALRKQSRPLPLEVALRVFLDALAGLHAAHELQGPDGEPLRLVHRDVSPHNVLVGVDGIARLTDFGIARAESRLSSTVGGQIKGKVAYMAPEQLQNGPVDRRADVYAAGVVLWELLTGQSMMVADSDGARIADVLHGQRRPPSAVAPSVPAALDATTMRALARSADDRFPTAADFAEAIESAGVPIASPRAVAAFVEELNVHQRPPDAPAPRSARSPFMSSNAAATVAPPADASLQTGAPKRRWIARTVGVAVALVASLVVVVRARAPADVAAASRPAPAESTPIEGVEPRGAPTVTPTASPSATTAAPDVPRPRADATANATAARPSAIRTARPPATAAPGKHPPASSTSFRPADL
jgi:serine/threonine-protein kinase